MPTLLLANALLRQAETRPTTQFIVIRIALLILLDGTIGASVVLTGTVDLAVSFGITRAKPPLTY